MKERRIHFDYETKPVSVKKNGLSLWNSILFVIILYSISKAITNGVDQDIIKTLIMSILK
jgi:hypothetical protein